MTQRELQLPLEQHEASRANDGANPKEARSPADFDYATFSPAVANEARVAADRIRERTRAVFLDVGRDLLAIKKQVEHGQFTDWVEHGCGIKIRTAQRAVRAAQIVEENDKLSYLPQDGLLALAARSTPATVISLVIDKIERGELPTVAEIKEEIAAHRPSSKRPPKIAQAPGPPKFEDADPLGRAISAVEALPNELRAEFQQWFWQTYSPGRAVLDIENMVEPTVPSPAQSASNENIVERTASPPSQCPAGNNRRIAEPTTSAPVQTLTDDGGLLAALDALTGDDHQNAYDWVMRGDALGHELPKGRAGEFCAQYQAASKEAHRKFRKQLTARSGAA